MMQSTSGATDMIIRAFTVSGIPLDAVASNLPAMRPFLENFARRDMDGYTVEDFERDILDGAAQAWKINDWQALALTYLTKEAVRITHCAGSDRTAWQEPLEQAIREWGRALGKKRVVATVRPGWSRFAKERGYREAHREMVMEI